MSTLPRRVRIASLLIDLEATMRGGGLWEREPPTEQALASVEPFCIDTLDFPQWLQFVFLPRMGALLHDGAPLPANCGVAAMAEVWFEGAWAARGADIVGLLREIDGLVEAGEGPAPPQKL